MTVPPPLELQHVIGMNSKIYNGFILHPNNVHIIYVLGSTIIVRDLHTNIQSFLYLPSDLNTVTGNITGIQPVINSIALSVTGKYLCVGTKVHGSNIIAPVIVYDLESFTVLSILSLHYGSITDISINHDESYIVTLGGVDDNKLIVWSIHDNFNACVGATAANDTTYCIRWTPQNSIVTCGSYNLRYWNYDTVGKKLVPIDASVGQIKRVYTSLVVLSDRVYTGTMSGDLFELMLPTVSNNNLFLLKRSTAQQKKHFQLGITCLALTGKNNLIVGTGDGTIAIVRTDQPELKTSKSTKLSGGVTSIQLNNTADHIFVTTQECNTYCIAVSDLKSELRYTSHSASINTVIFPKSYSQLFMTTSQHDIRIWQLNTTHELLRITVPNVFVNCAVFSADGRVVYSGWSDGAIRGFTPQSGKLLFCIQDACTDGCTALTVFNNVQKSNLLISGSQTGQVRVWQINAHTQSMIHTLKEHKQAITSLNVSHDDTECVSASLDGSCIIWDTSVWLRKHALVQSTQFHCCIYHTDSTQLLTVASDKKITYWDATDATPIRILDTDEHNTLYSITVDSTGTLLCSAGADKLLKVWNYDTGLCEYMSSGHSAEINDIAVTPDNSSIVSVDNSGGIYIYAYPQDHSAQQSITDENNVSQNNVVYSPTATQSSLKLQSTQVPQPIATTHRSRATAR